MSGACTQGGTGRRGYTLSKDVLYYYTYYIYTSSARLVCISLSGLYI